MKCPNIVIQQKNIKCGLAFEGPGCSESVISEFNGYHSDTSWSEHQMSNGYPPEDPLAATDQPSPFHPHSTIQMNGPSVITLIDSDEDCEQKADSSAYQSKSGKSSPTGTGFHYKLGA
jgi:hypothetical protein